jgi:hypothetical protein
MFLSAVRTISKPSVSGAFRRSPFVSPAPPWQRRGWLHDLWVDAAALPRRSGRSGSASWMPAMLPGERDNPAGAFNAEARDALVGEFLRADPAFCVHDDTAGQDSLAPDDRLAGNLKRTRDRWRSFRYRRHCDACAANDAPPGGSGPATGRRVRRYSPACADYGGRLYSGAGSGAGHEWRQPETPIYTASGCTVSIST